MPYMKRYLGRINFASGATVTLSLPREHFYNRLLLDFQLELQASTSNTWVANAHKLAATRIEEIANGQLVIKSFSAYQKYMHNFLTYGTPSLEVGAGVAADTTARRLDIIVENAINTADITCLLPSHLLSSLDLKITWNTLAALTGIGTPTVVATFCDVYSLEMINQGQDARSAILNKETVITRNPTAIGFSEFDLPLGNVYREMTLFTQGGATAGYQNNTVTDLELVQDGVVFHRRTNFLEFLAENIIESSGIISPSIVQPVGASPTQTESMNGGCVMIELDYQNYNCGGSSNPVALLRALPHLPDTSKMATWKLRCNVPSVANAVTLDLMVQELIMPKTRR
jgi:hypothetical protein